MRHNILNPLQSMGITHWAKVGQYYSSSSRSTWLRGRCGRHNYPTASSVMDFIFHRSSILPKLKLLPPTTEAFRETVKRAHFKLVFGKLYCNKIHQSWIDLSLVGHPKDDQVHIAQCRKQVELKLPLQLYLLINSSCSSDMPCSSQICNCSSAQMACSLFCQMACSLFCKCENTDLTLLIGHVIAHVIGHVDC